MSGDHRMRQEVNHLPEGRAVLAWPDGMSPGSFEDFRDWLTLILRKAERSVRDDAPAGAAGGGEGGGV